MNWEKPKVYAVKHKDISTRVNSRSGGIFTALSDKILKENGVVYGCVLTENFNALHIRTENIKDRNLMRGSKYIQSALGDNFSSIKGDLENGRKVLFSGTSCQVSGLKSFLKKEYPNLFCLDIVCHGVPSSRVWHEYLKWQENKNKSKCIKVDFRNKKDYGWSAHVESLYFINSKGEKKRTDSEIFKTIYYTHYTLRPCCYYCPYKSIMHPSDITIGDYWGIEKAAPGFNDNKGVSLVLINNNVGENEFNSIKPYIDYKECRIEDSMRPSLDRPFPLPKNRKGFWEDLEIYPFEKIVKKYGGCSLKSKIKKLYKKMKI